MVAHRRRGSGDQPGCWDVCSRLAQHLWIQYVLFSLLSVDWRDFWEHSHRLVASVVGFMTLLLAVWAQGKNGRLWLRYGFFPLGLLASLVVFLRIQENQAQHLSITLGFAAVVGAVSFFWLSLIHI